MKELQADGWTKTRKGSGTIYTHPQLPRAIVDTNGLGINARISYDSEEFDSVKAAKKYAMSTLESAPAPASTW